MEKFIEDQYGQVPSFGSYGHIAYTGIIISWISPLENFVGLSTLVVFALKCVLANHPAVDIG